MKSVQDKIKLLTEKEFKKLIRSIEKTRNTEYGMYLLRD